MIRHYCDRCECELGKSPFAEMIIDINLNVNKDTEITQTRKKEYCQSCYNKIIALIEGDE